jgi:7-keto-8-aminopelargonate synthetase-like enzyme
MEIAAATTQKTGHHRNTKAVIERAAPNFDLSFRAGIMGLSARSLERRLVEIVDGAGSRKVVDFVRCSYLGLDNHPHLIAGAIEALSSYGSLHWSCARTRLNFALLGELEEELSDLFASRVVTYSTVLAANMSALPLLASGHLTGGEKPLVVFDRFAHATLAAHKATLAAETAVATIAHNDVAALEDICRSNRSVVYICDGLYSMGGAAPMTALLQLQERHGLFLYIDDAHGVSLFGKNGEGYARSHIGQPLGDRTIIAASLGKGFGASGGLLMVGNEAQERLLRRFSLAQAFSVPVNLAGVGAALASAKLHRTPELQNLQSALRERTEEVDRLFPTSYAGQPFPIRTIEMGDEQTAIEAARTLLEAGFYTSAVFFPTVAQGRAALRICPTATHSRAEIEALANAFAPIRSKIRK